MTGKYYEELTLGLAIEHSIRRTVSEYDNTLFSAITHNLAPLHLDEEYSKTTMYGGRIINSMFTLALVCGVTVGELTQARPWATWVSSRSSSPIRCSQATRSRLAPK